MYCAFLYYSLHTKRQQQNKDVGMGKYERVSAGTERCRDGVMNDFCLGVGIFLFPFFFMT